MLLPNDGVCVSTQVGCAVGCVFCMTGRDGLLRQLGSAEIVAQVALARARRPVRRVVFMGMGEPAHNLDNVLEAIDLLGTEGGLGHKNLVFSTVGDRRVFERLPQGPVKPALALSLHTTKAGAARASSCRARRASIPAELVELGERYARATHYPIQYQWTLLEGVNDGDDELERHRGAARGQVRGDELHPVQHRRGPGLPPPVRGARGGDGALSAPARRARQAAPLGGPGRRGRVRAAARAGRCAVEGQEGLVSCPTIARNSSGSMGLLTMRKWLSRPSSLIAEDVSPVITTAFRSVPTASRSAAMT